MMENKLPNLSIVVATYMRPRHLAKLLSALRDQTVSVDEFEVIVVDNESVPNPDVVKMCDLGKSQGLHLRHVHNPMIGVSSARNRGLQEAAAGYIAFLDDDVVPSPGWIAQVFKSRQGSGAEIIGGPYSPSYSTTPPKWFKDRYASQNFGDQPCWMPKNKYLAGCNMIWKKELLLQLGGFREDLGYSGDKKIFGEDSEVCQRAYLAGKEIWYDPALMVLHHCECERMDVRWFLAAAIRHGLSKARLVFREIDHHDKRSTFRKALSVQKVILIDMGNILKTCLLFPAWKRKHSFWQNYAIEDFGTALGRIVTSSELLRLVLRGKPAY